ncbi:hypothetical protein [Rubricoccus marinus]|uniref:Uncharacterized protein n=1 Tax=Rubricoccus marinus TaxID=716817 RepID=A0A259TVL9_9BACT|nr:hypothetical protein [Rubricoccus marinus]OZC01783.1 hypothetical protein BSZ36_01540 [Rubricoccus marinus]
MTAPFHVTVACGPPEGVPDLAAEVALVRAGLLYGDRVALVSPGASLLRRLLADAALASTPRQRLDLLASLADDLGLGAAPLAMRERLGEPDVAATVRHLWRAFRGRLDRAAQSSGLDELAVAERAGALEIVDLAGAELPADLAACTSDHYAARVTDAVASGVTYPLLDGATGEALRQRLDLSPGRAHQARHIALAAQLVERLPLFDLATVAETLDVRADLHAPLARFRGAVLEFSEAIARGAPRRDPWDADFARDAEQVYRRDVAPAVEDIRDAIQSTGYLRALVSRYADRPALLAPLAAPALALAVAGPDALTHAVGLAIGGLSVAANAAQARYDAGDRAREAEAHRLFFYVAAGDRFARG